MKKYLLLIIAFLHIFASCPSNFDINFHRFINLPTPISSDEPATKAYIDSLEANGSLKGFVIDIEGWIHPTIKIGTQIWLGDNIYIATYTGSGDSMENWGREPLPHWDSSLEYTFSYPQDKLYGDGGAEVNLTYIQRKQFGNFYQYGTAVDDKDDNGTTWPVIGICPLYDGWHIPSVTEFDTLALYLGGASIAGKQMKAGGTGGFNALFSGYRSNDGNFYAKGLKVYYWTSDPIDENNATAYLLEKNSDSLTKVTKNKSYGLSVRCVKNAP